MPDKEIKQFILDNQSGTFHVEHEDLSVVEYDANDIAILKRDESGNVTGIQTVEGIEVPTQSPNGNFIGGTHFAGNSQWTNGFTGLRSTRFKVQAEAPFTMVRLGIGLKANTGTPPTFKALVSPTEVSAVNTVQNAYVPIVNGTQYNALATTAYGFRQVTFNGNATGTPPFAASASNAVGIILSDYIPCPSVPMVGGGRPMMVGILTQDTAGAPATSLSNPSTSFPAYHSARGLPLYREWVAGISTSDWVSNFGLPADVLSSNMNSLHVWVEFAYSVPTRSVAVCGDSTHQSSNAEYAYNSWTRQALAELSTQEKPISHVNFAGSGHSQEQFHAVLKEYLRAGGTLTDVVLQGWSQNAFTQNPVGAATSIGRTTNLLRELKDLGITVWMTTSYAVNGYTGAAEAGRLQCISQVKAWAEAGLVNLVDTDAIVTDYSGGAGIIRAEYNSGDNVHANALGARAMSDELKRVWK